MNMKKSENIPLLILVAVLIWRWVLLLFFAQPIPANDAFFYDGAVINYILHGKYVNPTLQLALPISSTIVFSAYPPFYQFCLFLWLSLFGYSYLAVPAFHLTLLSLSSIILYLILKKFSLPWYAITISLLIFSFNTWHDRPDTLAITLGICSIYLLLISNSAQKINLLHLYSSGFFLFLCNLTSIQVSFFYNIFILLLIFLKDKRDILIKIVPYCIYGLIYLLLVFYVIFQKKLWWEGFLEHATFTPSLKLKFYHVFFDWFFSQALTVVRRTLVIDFLLFLLIITDLLTKKAEFLKLLKNHIVLSSFIVYIIIIFTALFLTTTNYIIFSVFFQCLLVPFILNSLNHSKLLRKIKFILITIFLFLFFIQELRFFGISILGVYQNHLFGIRKVEKLAEYIIDNSSEEDKIVASSAYLYFFINKRNKNLFHSDYVINKEDIGGYDFSGLLKTKPKYVILTQYDYYRRYKTTIEKFLNDENVNLQIINYCQLPLIDSSRYFNRFIQHIYWAPVLIKFEWHNN